MDFDHFRSREAAKNLETLHRFVTEIQQLGFEHVTGPLWKHERIGIIAISKDDAPSDLVQKIYDKGYGDCQATIRSSLGIKE